MSQFPELQATLCLAGVLEGLFEGFERPILVRLEGDDECFERFERDRAEVFLGGIRFDLDFVHQGEMRLLGHLDELVTAFAKQIEKFVEVVVTRNAATGDGIEKGAGRLEERVSGLRLQVVLIEMVQFAQVGLGARSPDMLEVE